MDEGHVSWGDASKYILIPVVLALAGFCGWTITALSAVPSQIQTQMDSATTGIVTELTGIRGDLQNLRIELAKLQVEIRMRKTK